MKNLADIPPTRVAANERSPNRKPRYKHQRQMAVRAAQQAAVLSFVRVGCSRREALERAHVPFGTLGDWRDDPQFRDALAQADKESAAYISGRLDGLKGMAVDVLEAALEHQSEEVKAVGVRVDAAKTILRGRGELTERAEVSGPGGKPIGMTLYGILQAAKRQTGDAELPAPGSAEAGAAEEKSGNGDS